MDEKAPKIKLIDRLFKKGNREGSSNSTVSWVHDHWETRGSAPIKDLEQAIGSSVLNIDDAIKTISDLLISRLNYVPNPGDQIIENEMSFLVLDMKSHRIGRVHIYPKTTHH